MKFLRICTYYWKKFSKLDVAVAAAICIAVVVGIAFIIWVFTGTSIVIQNNQQSGPISQLSGKTCANAEQRPIAVMLASDPEARPLSGVGFADMVFEVPVTPDGITRMMAVFQCETPEEIGSIRSARQDFIPLARGLDAILAHWGGERDALDDLNAHIMDNIDALTYEGSTFYRKSSIPRPHNGFTTLALLRERAEDLDYRLSASDTIAYPHTTNKTTRKIGTAVDEVVIAWPQDMSVRFSYNPKGDMYLRWRGGTPEIDTITGEQVRASVVIVMETKSTFLYDQYISVQTLGQGPASIYQNGRKVSVTWKKPTATSMLTFIDDAGNQIPLEPGLIWVLIDASSQ